MTLQQAAWQKNPGVELAEYEAMHPYPFAGVLGAPKNESIKPSRFPGWQLLILAILITGLLLF